MANALNHLFYGFIVWIIFFNFKDFFFLRAFFFFFNLILDLNVSTDLFYIIFG